MGRGYQIPDLGDRKIVNLLPDDVKGTTLTHDTPVVIINRGNATILDKFDGRDYSIEPGECYQLHYAAALHFKKRSVVPGTRDPERWDGPAESFIGIFGVDKPEACEPFTEDDLVAMGEIPEALDRSAMANSEDRGAGALPIRQARTSSSRGTSRKPQVSAAGQATAGASEAAENIRQKPATSLAEQDERQAPVDPADLVDQTPMQRASAKARRR